MLVNDEKVRKSVWDGVVPIVFNLAPSEIITFQPPAPYYIVAPRNSYLPLVTNAVREHFIASAPVVVVEMWFEFNGIPLKWHHPIGVLFDTFATSSDIPWALTVHFQGFPANAILRCPNEETVRSHFANTLKEANYIKHSDNSKVNMMSLSGSNALWEGVQKNDYDLFWSANKGLSADLATMKGVPIRICRPNQPFMMDLMDPKDETGTERTLGSVLAHFLPEFSSTSDPAKQKDTKIFIQGISPPLEATVLWLYDNFAHPDNFLYIIVHSPPKE